LRPPAGVDLSAAEAVVGKLHVMVAMDGNAKAGKWLEHVMPRGLTFRHSGREGRWRHFEGAAVRMAGGVRHCRVDRCRFAGLGASGVVIWNDGLSVPPGSLLAVAVDGRELAGLVAGLDGGAVGGLDDGLGVGLFVVEQLQLQLFLLLVGEGLPSQPASALGEA